MWKVAIKFYQLLRDWVAGALDRLRRPGGVLRLACAVLASVCVFGAVQLHDQKTQIHELQISSLRCEVEIEGARGKIQGWDSAISQIRETLVADALERERQLEQSRLELAAAQADREEAAARAEEFMQRYDSQGEQCAVTRAALDRDCAELEGY